MSDHQIDRGDLLKAVGALGTLGVLSNLHGVQVAAAATQTPTILGAWLVTVTTHGPLAPAPIQSLHTFAMGTAFWETSIIDRTPQPDPSFGPGSGIWVAGTYGTVKKRWFKFRFDPFGNYTGYLDCKLTNTLGPSGDTFTGTGTAEQYDLTGKLVATYTSSEQGTRIKIDF